MLEIGVWLFSARKGRKVNWLFALLILWCLNSTANAHNQVVVVPLAGDDGIDFPPPSPVAKIAPQQSDYIIAADTVIDRITDLEWQRADIGDNEDSTNFQDAHSYCSLLELGGHDDWRLPTLNELLSIASFDSVNPTINEVAFTDTNLGLYWSSTLDSRTSNGVYALSFTFGTITLISNGSSFVSTRCVR